MARQTIRRRTWTAVGLLGALTSITTGAWGLREWAPFGSDPVPITWPHNVQPLVDFVQAETQLRFTRFVAVEFIADPATFRSRAVPTTTPTSATRSTVATDEAVGRALGFWSGQIDLLTATETLRSAGDFSSAWLRADNTVVVRSADENADLSPFERADLVVTLTEIIDDQQFQVVDHLKVAPTAQSFQALAALDLGRALWLHGRYVEQFDSHDKAEFDKAALTQGTAYLAKVGRLPPAFRALRAVAQRLGTAFITALQERGNDAVASAFTHDVPNALDQLSMPDAKYRRRDRVESIHPPPLPRHASLLYHRQLGLFSVYLVLAGGLAPAEALTAADGWGNDSFTAYRLAGRVCVDGRIVAESIVDADRIEHALDGWVHARPKDSNARLERNGA